MYNQARRYASLFCIFAMGCGSPGSTISVDCTNSVQDTATEIACTNQGNQIPTIERVDDPPPETAPCVRTFPSVNAWVSADGSESSYSSVVLGTNGERWYTMLDAPPWPGRLVAIRVLVRPQASEPVAPAEPMSLTLFSGDDLTVDQWSTVAEELDSGEAAPHYVTIEGIDEAFAPDMSIVFMLRAQAPFSNTELSNVVLESVPYLYVLTNECD